MTNQDTDKVLFLFSQMMGELRDIKKELKDMNKCLAVTVERQTISLGQIKEIKSELEVVKKAQATCPARNTYQSKKQLVKDYSVLIALFLSLYTAYSILFKS